MSMLPSVTVYTNMNLFEIIIILLYSVFENTLSLIQWSRNDNGGKGATATPQ